MAKLDHSVEVEPAPWKSGRVLASLTLWEWGALLVYFYCSGRLTSLLHPNFHLLVLVTGVLLVASGCLLWWRGEADVPIDPACEGGCCEPSRNGFSAGRLFAFLVLSVPIALSAMIAPDSYGSGMVRNRGIVETVGAAAAVGPATPRPVAVPSNLSPNGGPAVVEVGDLLIAAQTESGMARYDGKRVELIGQVFPLGLRRFELVRMLMLCCAADAQMLAVRVVSDHDLQLSAMKWAKVTGRVGFTKKGNRDIPVLTAEKVMPVERPSDPYVYHGGSLPVASPRSDFKVQLPPR